MGRKGDERMRTRITGRLGVLGVGVLAASLALMACAEPTETDPDAPEAPATEEASEEGERESAAEPAADDDARTLRVAIPDDVETLDPAFGQSELTNLVLKNVYLQPIQYLPGEFEQGVAYADTTSYEGQSVESWEFSDDFRTLTFELREGMTFPTSGNPVTGEDFVWTIERALETEAGPAWVWGNLGLTSMDQVELVNESTVVLSDLRPSAIMEPLLRDQTLGLIDSVEVSSHATDDDPWALAWLSQNYAGNGRYLVDNWDSGARMDLVANPEWPGGEPYFNRIELQVVPESSNRLALLQNGDVDIALDLSTQELQQAAGSDGVDVLSIADRQALNLGMNLRQEPFDSLEVRQALSYAVPYGDIVDGVLQGRAVPSEGPISVHSRYYDLFDLGDLWPYEHNPERAEQLLAEAGYEDGFSFELITPQGLPFVEATAANLRAAFSDVGVEMTITPVSSAAMAERLAQREFDAFLRGYLTDYVDDPYYHFFLWWGTDTVLNWVGYSDPGVDAVLEDTAEIVEDEPRQEPYREAIGQVIDDAPMLWMANANFTLAMRDDITSYVHHPDTLLFFSELEREG